MRTRIDNLASCTLYTVEIGAGPVIQGDTTDYRSEEDKEALEQVINNHWNFDKSAFRGFASTSPVSCYCLLHQF